MTLLFQAQRELGKMSLRPVDITDTDAVVAALPGARLLWLETTTNPMAFAGKTTSRPPGMRPCIRARSTRCPSCRPSC